MSFDDARVWLTGASSGIGEALVAPLVRRGARVAITARRTDLLTAIAAKHAGGGAAVLVVPADVTDRAASPLPPGAWNRNGAGSISRSSTPEDRSARRRQSERRHSPRTMTPRRWRSTTSA
jgi:NAD(P)-dependent dehydrogenase (short-subunit alcohol dehydrogenase family)